MRFYLLICGDHHKIIAISLQSSLKKYRKVNHVSRELITADHQSIDDSMLINNERERERE